jgi:DNA-directed RNA polymerase sigma subunit (sigma70/sigma32)
MKLIDLLREQMGPLEDMARDSFLNLRPGERKILRMRFADDPETLARLAAYEKFEADKASSI